MHRPMIIRKCPVPGCRSNRTNRNVFCPGDWELVPPELKARVNAEADKAFASPTHKAAAKEALAAVLKRLGRSPMKGSPHAV